MYSSKQKKQSDPLWWSAQHTMLWEQREPQLRRDLESVGDEVARLGPDDALVQRHPTTPRNVSVDRAHTVPDDNWEVGAEWEQLEPGLRFGVGACAQYARYEAWSEELEVSLRADWDATHEPGTWERMKRTIRRGFEAARRKPS